MRQARWQKWGMLAAIALVIAVVVVLPTMHKRWGAESSTSSSKTGKKTR